MKTPRQLPLPDERVCAQYDDICHKTGLSNAQIGRAMGVSADAIWRRRRAMTPVRRESMTALKVLLRKIQKRDAE